MSDDYSSRFESISELVKLRNQLAKQALNGLRYEVSDIINTKSLDGNRIEHLLDNLFDFCFDPEVLEEFKRLLRYYLPINPESVHSHINHYRDWYDSDDQEIED